MNVCSTKVFNLLYTVIWTDVRRLNIKPLTVQDVRVHLEQTKYQTIYYMFKLLSARAHYVRISFRTLQLDYN